MSNIFLNLGSNLGDRRKNLSRAVAAIEKEFGYFELSHTVQSQPWGYESENEFLNVGMMIISDLSPLDILHKLQAIEKSLGSDSHRHRDGTYADREIDIDIIAIDDMVVDHPELQLPHPRMHERSFVLEPMAELARFWVHPVLKQTPGEMLWELNRKEN